MALVVIVFHISGLAHLAVDVFEITTTGHHSGTPFDDDDDAPPTPGSPSTHHAQAGGAPLASTLAIDVSTAPLAALLSVITESDVPTAPPRAGLYRPPRA
jgi:hypothetical protein